jgi:TRAP-type C4-dicarboxylate transport system permease small subunit
MSERTEITSRRRRAAGLVVSLSEGVLYVEKFVIGAMMAALAGLILFNVVTRYTGFPVYWGDEVAVYIAVWLTFIGASTMIRRRLDFSMTIMTEKLGPGAAHAAKVCATALVILFALLLGYMCWLWLDPVGIVSAGFDPRTHSGNTFNFVYTDQTQTLNLPRWMFYLVLPIFAATLLVHGLANLFEDLGLVPRVERHLEAMSAESVS